MLQQALGDAPVVVLTPGADVTLDVLKGKVFTLTPAQACNINAINMTPHTAITLIILTSGTSSYTITFNTNMKSTGTLATGTADGKYFVVKLVSNATLLIEASRTTAM